MMICDYMLVGLLNTLTNMYPYPIWCLLDPSTLYFLNILFSHFGAYFIVARHGEMSSAILMSG